MTFTALFKLMTSRHNQKPVGANGSLLRITIVNAPTVVYPNENRCKLPSVGAGISPRHKYSLCVSPVNSDRYLVE
ncbi:MAG: hypothetical protein F6K24_05215 [Okeania sp. SIO2D1]|nr:hypothetical protein [Okeania sp. SIO2D1]